jgi:hypothetical protein
MIPSSYARATAAIGGCWRIGTVERQAFLNSTHAVLPIRVAASFVAWSCSQDGSTGISIIAM